MSNVSTCHFYVDAARRLLQRPSRAARTHCQDLGEDRERRLGRGVGADVEACWARDPIELLLRHARLEQPLATARLVAAGAERAHVERLARERPAEGRDVESVVMRQDDDRGGV